MLSGVTDLKFSHFTVVSPFANVYWIVWAIALLNCPFHALLPLSITIALLKALLFHSTYLKCVAGNSTIHDQTSFNPLVDLCFR